MMSIKLNWKRLKFIQENLNVQKNTPFLFLLLLSNGRTDKRKILFKDFMKSFWIIENDKKNPVIGIIVKDIKGNIIYRYKKIDCEEKKPENNGGQIIQNWANISPQEKEIYIKLLISQIHLYEE